MAADEIAENAFDRAWRVYRRLNNRAQQSSERRTALKQFIRRCCDHGAMDAEAIVVLALFPSNSSTSLRRAAAPVLPCPDWEQMEQVTRPPVDDGIT